MMHINYVVPDTFLQDYPSIRANYEAKAQVSLTSTPQPYSFFVPFGATDVETRRKQIEFLEGLFEQVKPKLKPLLDFKNESERLNHIAALRILLAGCLYIKAQIDETYTYPLDSSSSDLGQVLNDLLKLTCEKTNDNAIDAETREAVLLTTRQFLSNRNVFDDQEQPHKLTIDEKKWAEFLAYIEKETAKTTKVCSDYPIRDFMQWGGKAIGTSMGASVGYIFGQVASRSEPMVGVHQAFSTVLGTGVLMMMGSSARMGVMVLVPTCASKILDMFCGVSLACVLGAAMGVAGAGVGWGVGMTLEMGISLLQKGCSLISRVYNGESQYPDISGITLVDSKRIIRGLECVVDDQGEMQEAVMHVGPEGAELKIGDQTAFIPWDLKKLPYMKELQELLAYDVSSKTPAVEYSTREQQGHEADETQDLELFPS